MRPMLQVLMCSTCLSRFIPLLSSSIYNYRLFLLQTCFRRPSMCVSNISDSCISLKVGPGIVCVRFAGIASWDTWWNWAIANVINFTCVFPTITVNQTKIVYTYSSLFNPRFMFVSKLLPFQLVCGLGQRWEMSALLLKCEACFYYRCSQLRLLKPTAGVLFSACDRGCVSVSTGLPWT